MERACGGAPSYRLCRWRSSSSLHSDEVPIALTGEVVRAPRAQLKIYSMYVIDSTGQVARLAYLVQVRERRRREPSLCACRFGLVAPGGQPGGGGYARAGFYVFAVCFLCLIVRLLWFSAGACTVSRSR